ncbi:AraC family transcriptional regulator [Streptomyces mutabilis]|uniref:AraC family transcriptional regulator n=1 Tax=Streptomyces TaxID=1883 RepID=UPI0015CB7E53|nr:MULTISPECIES: AraC family transcriptional regulator [unclassified Streptomyces]MDN3244733.1 AraC family transcriptional regulator [Streptomyces sp. ZSW22]MDN3252713.1 AraC family transcriptional regulator [Streptomyces sp. MA25(2023)]
MDPLSSLLSGIRAEGSVVSHAVLTAPWSIRFTDDAPLTMVSVLRGGGTLLLSDGTERAVGVGDTAIVRGPAPFRLVDGPTTLDRPHTEYEIACFTPDAECTGQELGGIRWGTDPDGATALIVGAYRASGHRHERLLRALPPVLVINEDVEVCAWLETAAADAARLTAGSQALMDRLLDWALVCTLRNWFDEAGADAPSWYRGLADPVLGPALQAFHGRPAEPWTVASLARQAGVSRALFAKRFTELMGRPPLAYLTECRMADAEALLTDTDLSIAQIAKSVGYADAFGFSAAFKRHKGRSPSTFRAAAA